MGDIAKSEISWSRKRQVALVAAFVCLWSWSFVVGLLPGLVSSDNTNWAWNTPRYICIAASILAIVFRGWLDENATDKRFVAGMCAASTLGACLILFSQDQAVIFFGFVLALGSLFLATPALISSCCRRVPTYSDLSRYVCIAYIASSCLWIICFFLIPDFLYVFGIALPAVSIFLFAWVARKEDVAPVVPREHYSGRKVLLSPVLAAYAAIVAMALGLLLSGLLADRSPFSATVGEEVYTVAADLIVIAVLAIDFFISKRRITIVPLAVLFLALIALMLQAGDSTQNVQAIYVIAIAAYSLLSPVITLRTARFCRKRKDSSGTGAFAAMLIAHMFGLTCGSLLAILFSELQSSIIIVITAIIICLFFIVSFLVLPGRTKEALTSLAKYPGSHAFSSENNKGERSSEETGEETSNATSLKIDSSAKRYSMLAASHYGLTKQEAATLEYVLQGWTLQAIANQECLSRNTVKTHVSHIYQKMGVHSRQGCLDALNELEKKELK